MGKFGQHRDKSSGFRRIRRPLTIACVVLLFFVFSNYYVGFFSSEPIKIKPAVPVTKPMVPKQPSTDPVDAHDRNSRVKNNNINNNNNNNNNINNPHDNQNSISKPISGGKNPSDDNNNINENNNNRNNNNNNNNNNKPHKNLSFDPPPVREDKWPEPGTCVHTRDRDYDKDPIVISGRFSGRAECDVPCSGEGRADAAVSSRSSQCTHVKSIFFTMENSNPPPGSYDIIANTRLSSEVPLPYFSWAEYDFRRPVAKKTAKAHVAAFISNCGPQRRLNWMEVMQKHGVKIDSYGSCMRNKEIPAEYSSKYGANYNGIKTDIISTYKFVMAFENSGTDDYVTEKLFGVLVAGSVPLYDGAPNGKKFGPASKSMVFADDFGTPEKLAEHILYLDGNDTAYEEYLQWKKTGPSDEWVALVDLAKVHSNCRLCIHTADMHRKEVGPVKKGQPEGEKKPSGKYLELHVRERGKFWLRPIYLTEFSMDQLKEKINEYVPHDKGSYLFSIHDLWTHQNVVTDEDIAQLEQKTELEAIFVVPENWESLNLMW